MTLVPGSLLADAGWLSDRVDELGRSWTCDRRTAGTLWWYMGSSTLLRDPVAALARGPLAPNPALAALSCTVRADGGLDTVLSGSTVEGIDAVGAALRDAWTAILPALARTSGAAEPALWSIAADALANQALDAAGLGGVDLASNLARVIGPALPTPRFVEVNGRGFVRRGSCCLIYETGKAGKCTSCPRRTPDERAGLLAALTDPGR